MRDRFGHYSDEDLQQLHNMPVHLVSHLSPGSNSRPEHMIDGSQFNLVYHGRNSSSFHHLVNEVMSNCPVQIADNQSLYDQYWSARLFRNGQSFWILELPCTVGIPINWMNNVIENCVQSIFASHRYQEENLLSNSVQFVNNLAGGFVFALNIMMFISALRGLHNVIDTWIRRISQREAEVQANLEQIQELNGEPRQISNSDFSLQLYGNTPTIRDNNLNDQNQMQTIMAPIMDPQAHDLDDIIASLSNVVNQLHDLNSPERAYIVDNWDTLKPNLTHLVERYHLSSVYLSQINTIEQNYRCPITQRIAAQYFRTSIHINYDAHSIFTWLQDTSNDPLTRQQLEPVLYDNSYRDRALSLAIQQLLESIEADLSNQRQLSHTSMSPAQMNSS